MVPVILAIICVVGFAALAVFHLALVFGAPLGRFAWGGIEDVLDGQRRVYSLFAAVIAVLAALVELQAVGAVTVLPAIAGTVAAYVVSAGCFALFIRSATSTSVAERQTMFPTFLGLAALSLIVAVIGHFA